jgi:hypothetical protein
MPSGIIKTDQKATALLSSDLSARVKKEAIEALGSQILANPSNARVASTKSVKELFETIPNVQTLIDDNATSAIKVWSSEKIVSYVAENDDSVAFANIAERDAFALVPERDGVTAIVADASADSQVGVDADGNPLGALYLRKDGAWHFLFTKGYKAINLEGYLNEDSLSNDATVNDPKVPVSSALTYALAQLITAADADANNMEIMPEISDITWDDVAQVNKVQCVYKPKGHPVNFEANVIDDVTGRLIPYACEFVVEDGVTFLHVLMAEPLDMSAAKVRFSYLHNGKANA